MSDSIAPVLKGLRLPASIDLSLGKGTLNIGVDAEDAGGISDVTIEFDYDIVLADRDDATKWVSFGTSLWSNDTFVDATPGTASIAWALSPSMSAGVYGIRSLSLEDLAGNYTTYSADMLAAMGLANSFTVTGTKVDRTAAMLTGLDLPATVDAAAGRATFTATARAIDNEGGNGVDSVVVTLDREMTFSYGPSRYLFIGKSFAGKDTFVDQTPNEGNQVATITGATAPGTYKVVTAQVYDASGNVSTYSGDQLAALGYSTTITVTGTVADTTVPVLEALRLPAYIDLAKGNQQVFFGAQANDGAGSGVHKLYAHFDRPLATTLSGAAWLVSLDDNGAAPTAGAGAIGSWAEVLQSTQAGTYNVTTAHVTDLAGNRVDYGIDELRDLGIRTRFTVGGGAADTVTAAATMRLDGDNLVVSFTALAGGETVHAGLRFDSSRLHFVGAIAPDGGAIDAHEMKYGEQGTVTVHSDGQPAGATQLFTLTFRVVGDTRNLSLDIDHFDVGARPQYFAGGDVLLFQHGDAGNDTLAGAMGNDWIDGGAGFDTVHYAMPGAGVIVSAVANGHRVTDGKGVDEKVAGVELLAFADRAVALDMEGTAADAYRLYRAAFDRPADKAGLGYWIAQIDKGVSTGFVAEQFIASPEFRSLYGATQTDQQFLSTLYQHVLHRAPDAAGLDYWLGIMASGAGRAGVLAEFSESTENHIQVIGAIKDGIEYVPYV